MHGTPRARSAAPCPNAAPSTPTIDAARTTKAYEVAKRGSGKQQAATTMAFVRLLKDLMRDKEFGNRIVPIIPDEARTFGMDAFFPTAKIYNPNGPELPLRGPRPGPGLQGIRARARSCTPASTRPAPSPRSPPPAPSYATHGEPLIPVYVFYSMFGFQRTGDAFWAAGGPDGPRLHHRRHRRPHHPDRRGPAARRRPLPAPGLHQPGRGHLRPRLRLRDRPHHARRPRAHVRPAAHDRTPERDVLPHGLQRADHPAGRTGGPRRRGHHQGHLPARRRPRSTARARQLLASGVVRAVGPRGPAAPRRGLGRLRRRLVRDLLDRTAPRRPGRRGRRLPQPRRARPRPVRHPAARRRHRTRSSPSRTT